MKKTNIIFKSLLSMMLLASLFSANTFAEGEKITLTNKAFKQIIKKDKDGNITYDYVKPELALPGDVILYTILVENMGADLAEDIVINNPVPNNSKYRSASATGKGTKITFSIDNGETFDVPEKLIVKDKDGKESIAKAEIYTHIRWVYAEPLAPGDKKEVSFKTEIKGNE